MRSYLPLSVKLVRVAVSDYSLIRFERDPPTSQQLTMKELQLLFGFEYCFGKIFVRLFVLLYSCERRILANTKIYGWRVVIENMVLFSIGTYIRKSA